MTSPGDPARGKGKQQDAAKEAERAARRARNAANRARREARAAERAAGTGLGASAATRFNILIVAQAGRLEYEALIFADSLRRNAPDWQGRLIVAEPRSDGAWTGHATALSDAGRAALIARGAEIAPITARHFGADWPNGNKIEALSLLPAGEPFIFFDSDTVVTGPLDRLAADFTRPSASMQREGTWPKPPLYGPEVGEIWHALYDRFGLDFDSSLDQEQPVNHWERYLYFNAGWFLGADPQPFAARYLDWARALRDDPGEALATQELFPWLDQIVLPLVIHSLGGGRPGPELSGLDGKLTCHWRKLPLLYARESEAAIRAVEQAAAEPDLRPILEGWKPAQALIYDQNGRRELRPRIDRKNLPLREQPLRQQIKRAGWWLV